MWSENQAEELKPFFNHLKTSFEGNWLSLQLHLNTSAAIFFIFFDTDIFKSKKDTDEHLCYLFMTKY